MLTALATLTNATETRHWLGGLMAMMSPLDHARFAATVRAPGRMRDFIAIACIDEMCRRLLRLPAMAATEIAAKYVTGWVLYEGWASSNGLDTSCLTPARLLSSVYMWQLQSCPDDAARDRLHVSLFGTPRPWG